MKSKICLVGGVEIVQEFCKSAQLEITRAGCSFLVEVGPSGARFDGEADRTCFQKESKIDVRCSRALIHCWEVGSNCVEGAKSK